MVLWFDNDEAGYLHWIESNPRGFVANVDRARAFPRYPMAHVAMHRLMSSPKIGNFTTGEYVKFCSLSLGELQNFAETHYRRALSRCSVCAKALT